MTTTTRAKRVQPEELLKIIARSFLGIAYDDLTRQERHVVDLLIAHGYAHRESSEFDSTEMIKEGSFNY